MKRLVNILSVSTFAASIPAANLLIENVGVKCLSNGPCLVPVAPGIMAPSGVIVIGVALVARDAIQTRLGMAWVVAAIAAGSILSGFFARPELVIASTVAFILSELADLVVYTPLARRNLAVAIVASGIVGSVADSVIFLTLAFGSFDFLSGQVIGKMWASIAVGIGLTMMRITQKPEISTSK